MEMSAGPAPPLFLLEDEVRSEYGRQPASRGASATLTTSKEQVLQQVQTIHTAHSQLHYAARTVLQSSKDGELNVNAVEKRLEENLTKMSSVQGFLDTILDSFPHSMRPTEQSAVKATKVLGTPELLEQILLELEPQEVLQAMQMNRVVTQIFADSPKLQGLLHLRAHEDRHLHELFDDCSRFEGFYLSVDNGGWVDNIGHVSSAWDAFNRVPITVRFVGPQLPRIGSLCRGMLISQPVVHRMRVTVSCCRHLDKICYRICCDDGGSQQDDEYQTDKDEDPTGATNRSVKKSSLDDTMHIYAESGITVAHIQDASEKLPQLHRHCPDASLHEHSPDGTVTPIITFSTKIQLTPNDPYLFAKEDREIRRQLSRAIEGYDSSGGNPPSVLSVYVSAKKTVHERGWPILTFEAFKDKYVVGYLSELSFSLPW